MPCLPPYVRSGNTLVADGRGLQKRDDQDPGGIIAAIIIIIVIAAVVGFALFWCIIRRWALLSHAKAARSGNRVRAERSRGFTDDQSIRSRRSQGKLDLPSSRGTFGGPSRQDRSRSERAFGPSGATFDDGPSMEHGSSLPREPPPSYYSRSAKLSSAPKLPSAPSSHYPRSVKLSATPKLSSAIQLSSNFQLSSAPKRPSALKLSSAPKFSSAQKLSSAPKRSSVSKLSSTPKFGGRLPLGNDGKVHGVHSINDYLQGPPGHYDRERFGSRQSENPSRRQYFDGR